MAIYLPFLVFVVVCAVATWMAYRWRFSNRHWLMAEYVSILCGLAGVLGVGIALSGEFAEGDMTEGWVDGRVKLVSTLAQEYGRTYGESGTFSWKWDEPELREYYAGFVDWCGRVRYAAIEKDFESLRHLVETKTEVPPTEQSLQAELDNLSSAIQELLDKQSVHSQARLRASGDQFGSLPVLLIVIALPTALAIRFAKTTSEFRGWRS